jgi:Domain of unknown function (DUF4160)
MPIVFRHDGFTFFFYSNEGNPREPVHVHVRKAGFDAKFWLFPDVSVADSYGFKPSTLRDLSSIIEANNELIKRSWHEHFGY